MTRDSHAHEKTEPPVTEKLGFVSLNPT